MEINIKNIQIKQEGSQYHEQAQEMIEKVAQTNVFSI